LLDRPDHRANMVVTVVPVSLANKDILVSQADHPQFARRLSMFHVNRVLMDPTESPEMRDQRETPDQLDSPVHLEKTEPPETLDLPGHPEIQDQADPTDPQAMQANQVPVRQVLQETKDPLVTLDHRELQVPLVALVPMELPDNQDRKDPQDRLAILEKTENQAKMAQPVNQVQLERKESARNIVLLMVVSSLKMAITENRRLIIHSKIF